MNARANTLIHYILRITQTCGLCRTAITNLGSVDADGADTQHIAIIANRAAGAGILVSAFN